METIRVRDVSKRFNFVPIHPRTTLKSVVANGLFRINHERKSVEALSGISFSVKRGQMLGVIGQNGSGKTTLLRLLAGVYQPDAGEIEMSGSLAPLLSLGAGFHPDLTGRENARIELLVLGLSPREIARRMDAIVDFSEIGEFIDAPVRTYSAGMTIRLAYAAAMTLDPDVLLLDEVLAVGDEAFANKCLGHIDTLRSRGKTIVLVTHSAQTVLDRCDVALWLQRGSLGAFGAPDAVVGRYHDALGERERINDLEQTF